MEWIRWWNGAWELGGWEDQNVMGDGMGGGFASAFLVFGVGVFE